MAVIPKNFGEGGAYLTSGDSSGKPDLAVILRDIATDLHTVNGSGSVAITAPALPAFSDPPTPVQMEALRTLVNQIRATLTSGGSGGGGGLLTTIG